MKIRGMDGPIDLFLYRPTGFAIAWALSFSRISPNAVSLVSILLGVAAGACALTGTPSAFLLCACLFQASNCFDCADGQLARLTGRNTKEGRILDGMADYLVNLSVYLGCLAGLVQAGYSPLISLLLVAAGGAATALSCFFYDRVITRQSKLVMGKDEDESEELEALECAASANGAWRLLWRAYALYAKLQRSSAGRNLKPSLVLESEEERKTYADRMYPMLMVWSFTGPSAHVLCFLVFAVLGKIDLYFAASVIGAAVTMVLVAVQSLIDLRLLEAFINKASRPKGAKHSEQSERLCRDEGLSQRLP
jgi:phosphatidylglycerophosphate synthase